MPARIPQLLLNGSAGIAVGMATNIPPHNLTELIDGMLALIANPEITDQQLLAIIPGPDFPTGGEVLVAWKPCWIPIENVPEGPLLINFRDAPKVRFLSSVGKLILPVEPDTALADDVAVAANWSERQIREHREHFQQRSSGMELPKRKRQHGDGTPRKALGSVAKKAASSTRMKAKNSKHRATLLRPPP